MDIRVFAAVTNDKNEAVCQNTKLNVNRQKLSQLLVAIFLNTAKDKLSGKSLRK
jgi:hypothetical protein